MKVERDNIEKEDNVPKYENDFLAQRDDEMNAVIEVERDETAQGAVSEGIPAPKRKTTKKSSSANSPSRKKSTPEPKVKKVEEIVEEVQEDTIAQQSIEEIEKPAETEELALETAEQEIAETETVVSEIKQKVKKPKIKKEKRIKPPKEPKKRIDFKTAVKNFNLKEFYSATLDKAAQMKALDFRTLGFKILIPIVLCLAVIITVSVSVVYGMMASLVKSTYEQSCENSMVALQDQIEKKGKDAITYATAMADDAVVKSGVAKNDMTSVTRRLSDFKTSSGCDYLYITDNTGTLIASEGVNLNKESFADISCVQKAITGESATEIVISEKFPLVAMGAVPLYNGLDQVQGTVMMGYSLNNPEFVDSLKRATGNEFTIFEGNVRKNTTVMSGEERQVGTLAAESIAKKVLENGNTYQGNAQILGETHACIYAPLTNAEGQNIGMLFVGSNIESIATRQAFALIFCIILAIILFLLTALIIFSFVRRIVSKPLEKLVVVAEKIERGDIGIGDDSLDVEVSQAKDEVGVLSRALGETVLSLKKYIGEISAMLSEIAQGNLLVESQVEYRGDFIAIKAALENITASLRETLSGITVAAEQVSSGAEQVAGGAQALSQGSTEQASAIEELSATITEISDNIKKTANSSMIAKEFGEESAEQVTVSNRQMQHMIEAMENISKSTVEISKIIKAIDDVAFQTNILALNAAVEAARAGAAGKGFAVVAEEVRKLAGKSSEAAEQTTSLISKTTKAVKKGSRITKTTAQSLEVVVEKSQRVMELIDEISGESNAQSRAVSEITLGVDQIASVVQTNSATAEESAAASEELSGQSALLNEMVSKFKIK